MPAAHDREVAVEARASSTRIEGTRLSDRDVERLPTNIESKSFASRDEQEVAGYAEVMETVLESWEAIELTENHIRQLHRDLLRYSDKDERHRGSYALSGGTAMPMTSRSWIIIEEQTDG